VAVTFSSVKSVQPVPVAGGWDGLRSLLSAHAERENKLDGFLWSPVKYRPNRTRSLNGVESVSCFVADLDGESLSAVLPRLLGIAFHAYTTWSHTSDSEHWHLVIPLSEPVEAWRWRSVWSRMHADLGIVGDRSCCDASRIYFAPQHPKGSEFEFVSADGDIYKTPSVTPLESDERSERIASPSRSAKSARESNDLGFLFSESWWNEPSDISRWEGLEGKELYSVLLAEWKELTKNLR
jgi:hypothetical protein